MMNSTDQSTTFAQLLETIETIEVGIRDLIHKNLSVAIGEEYYWDIAIPYYIRDDLISRAVADARARPDKTSDNANHPRQILNYCTLLDCDLIILERNNWPHFEPIFRTRDDFRTHLNALCDFIYAVKDKREISDVMLQDAELALVWFTAVLSSTSEVAD